MEEEEEEEGGGGGPDTVGPVISEALVGGVVERPENEDALV